jgi:tetratricopeptide (TPR) repeat protein
MFLVLALIFGVGFVAFGVGSDVQGGIADVLGVGASSSGPSVEAAEEKLDANPTNAEALYELAIAHETEGNETEAISALERYVAVRPRDDDALRKLAGMYLGQASVARNDYLIAQEQAALLNPGATFLPSPDSPLGQAFASQPIVQASTSDATAAANDAYSRLIAAYGQAKTTYQQVVKIDPEDASSQLDLAGAAQNAGDVPVALAAYKRFLALAPDDPSAPGIREVIKQLEAQQTTAGGSSSSG